MLEVEEDNSNALQFYQNRDYKILYEDPTSRRYDTSGLFLQQKRCKRIVMHKQLLLSEQSSMVSAVESTVRHIGIQVLQRLREGLFLVNA